MQKYALKDGAIRVGQNKYFFPATERAALTYGLEARRGYFMSVRPTVKTLMMNVNTSFAAFYSFSGPLHEILQSMLRDIGQLPPPLFFKLKVVTSHLGYKKTHTVFRLGNSSARRTTFSRDGQNVSVESYFKSGRSNVFD